MKQLKPNFFIIGAPKCGTTSLSVYLSEHREIVMSHPKEPHYFSTDIENGRMTDQSKYLACFAQDKTPIAVGDASTLYLYSKDAIQNILEFNPNAKFIVMLRKPIDIVLSFHQVALNYFGETETNLETAWDLQIDRKNGKQIPKGCPDPQLLLYGKIAKLGAQVKRLTDQVRPDQIKFIYFDEFVNKTDKIYCSVLEFLKVNKNHTPNQAVGLKKAVGIKKQFGVAKKIHTVNVKGEPPKQMSRTLKTTMNVYFEKDIQLLSDLMNKNLSDWSNQ
jgi:hypothetical protein